VDHCVQIPLVQNPNLLERVVSVTIVGHFVENLPVLAPRIFQRDSFRQTLGVRIRNICCEEKQGGNETFARDRHCAKRQACRDEICKTRFYGCGAFASEVHWQCWDLGRVLIRMQTQVPAESKRRLPLRHVSHGDACTRVTTRGSHAKFDRRLRTTPIKDEMSGGQRNEMTYAWSATSGSWARPCRTASCCSSFPSCKKNPDSGAAKPSPKCGSPSKWRELRRKESSTGRLCLRGGQMVRVNEGRCTRDA
jgi:hypothetical protein